MAIQEASAVDVRYVKEGVWGEIPVGGTVRSIEKVSLSLNLMKDSYSSNRIRSDRQVVHMRHGGRKVEGDLNDELSTFEHDVFMEASLCGFWTPGRTATGAFTADSATGGLTRAAGQGSFIMDGFCAGDIVDLSGFTDPANNGRQTLKTVEASAITFVGGALVDEVAPVVTVSVVGSKVENAKARRSFLFEVASPDVDGDNFERYKGIRFNTMSVGLAPTGLVTIRYALVGKDMELSDTPVSSFVTSGTIGVTPSLLASVDGTCTIDGEEAGLLTALDIQVENGITGSPVVGRNFVPALLYGRSRVSGSFTAMVDSNRFLTAFSDEKEIAINLRLDGDGEDFLRFYIPRAKLSGCTRTVQGEAEISVQCNFVGLFSFKDSGAIIIQRSNV